MKDDKVYEDSGPSGDQAKQDYIVEYEICGSKNEFRYCDITTNNSCNKVHDTPVVPDDNGRQNQSNQRFSVNPNDVTYYQNVRKAKISNAGLRPVTYGNEETCLVKKMYFFGLKCVSWYPTVSPKSNQWRRKRFLDRSKEKKTLGNENKKTW